MSQDVEIQNIKACFSYDPQTGIVSWKTPFRRREGFQAGSVSKKGYRRIFFKGRMYRNHRIAWLLTHGEWPQGQLDHVNGIKDDNRIDNLRIATDSQNQFNRKLSRRNTSGFKGVHFCKSSGLWKAEVYVNYKKHSVGRYRTRQAAAEAARLKREELHGEFACHG